jgi:hypothetical protein
MKASIVTACLLALAGIASAATTNEVALLKAVYQTERITTTREGYIVSPEVGRSIVLTRTNTREGWRVDEHKANPDIGLYFDAEREAKKWRKEQRAHR